MISSKSLVKVSAEALAAGREAFDDYSYHDSPHKFTQPQLFACLVLKEFEKKDYRGVWQLLLDCSDLRAAIGLATVPHYTTLRKASRRLLKLDRVRQLVAETVRRVNGRRKRVKYAAADSGGFEARHAGTYFIFRTKINGKGKGPKKRHTYRHYGKPMVVTDTATHAVVAAVASVGPTPDVDQLDGVMAEVPPSVTILHVVADAGFDSAYNHEMLRGFHGTLSTIPARGGRPQVQTVLSMMKRNFGSALRGTKHHSRMRNLYIKVLTHNLALALAWFSTEP